MYARKEDIEKALEEISKNVGEIKFVDDINWNSMEDFHEMLKEINKIVHILSTHKKPTHHLILL